MKNIKNFLWTILLLLILLNIAPNLLKGIKTQYKSMLKPKAKIARITINDAITDIRFYQQSLEQFFKDKEIKAILLEIDSPGGAAGSSQSLYNEIMHLKTTYNKPIAALTYNLCTSGAYNIAIATDYIVAAPSALIGSVGSYINQFKVNEFINHWNVQYEIEKSGTYKGTLNPFIPSTPEQKTMLQALSSDCYDQFIHDVACRRKLSLKNVDEWANGRIFTGRQAFKKNLIDEIGSEYNVVQKLKEIALIEHEIEWVKPAYPSILSKLLNPQDIQPLLALFNQLKGALLSCLNITGINE